MKFITIILAFSLAFSEALSTAQTSKKYAQTNLLNAKSEGDYKTAKIQETRSQQKITEARKSIEILDYILID